MSWQTQKIRETLQAAGFENENKLEHETYSRLIYRVEVNGFEDYLEIVPHKDYFYMELQNQKGSRVRFFRKRINFRYVDFYVACFLNTENKPSLWWMNQVLQRTKFADKCLSYVFDGNKITMHLEVKLVGSKEPVEVCVKLKVDEKDKTLFQLMGHKTNVVKTVMEKWTPSWMIKNQVFHFLSNPHTQKLIKEDW
ncbi:MAG: hypothetical protein U9Q69_01265 [Nanoarchaeota archaeon]|nr:hypothetical protein [Nanoarchaeota archaeon]